MRALEQFLIIAALQREANYVFMSYIRVGQYWRARRVLLLA